ncbi:MAG: NHLP leader peptide family RiPP precursor [Rubrobacteraceae bacterium]
MTEASGGSPEEIRQRLIQRSTEDEELRQRLLEDPKAAIEQEVGARLPEELEIRVVEETPDIVYLVLPPKLEGAIEAGELSGEELESVAGGAWTGADYTACYTANTCAGCYYSVS